MLLARRNSRILAAVGQSCENLLETGGLREVHVAHCLIIAMEGRDSRGRRNEAKGSGPDQVVVGPRTAKELALPLHDAVSQFMAFDGFARRRVLRERRRICVVAGEPVRGRFLRWPVVFGVQYRRLLPLVPRRHSRRGRERWGCGLCSAKPNDPAGQAGGTSAATATIKSPTPIGNLMLIQPYQSSELAFA